MEIRTFDVKDLDKWVVGRQGTGLYGVVKTVCDQVMAEVEVGKAVLVREIVAKVREAAKNLPDGEDPGYQAVCVRLRNYVTSSKKYRLVTNASRISFIVKK